MTGSGRFLAYVGGGILGLLLGSIPGGCIGYYAFQEPIPPSQMEHPGDWLSGISDFGARVSVNERNLAREFRGCLIGAGMGLAVGLLLAARATMPKINSEDPADTNQ